MDFLPEITGGTEFSVMGLVLYTIWKEVVGVWKKRLTSQKKDAASLRDESIDRTLTEVAKYLKILTNKENKEITKDQAEVVMDHLLTSKMYRIIKHVHITLKENHVSENRDLIDSRLDVFFETLNDTIANKLNKFNYNGQSLFMIYSSIFVVEVKDLVKTIIFNSKIEPGDVYQRVNKLLEEKFNSYRINFNNKL